MFKSCSDQVKRRCAIKEEMPDIIYHCQSSDYRGHFGSRRMAIKVLQSSFYWPILFKDVKSLMKQCGKCQSGSMLRGQEITLHGILEVKIFDVWGLDSMRPFVSSNNNIYILVSLNYVSKWVEPQTFPTNNVKVMIKFMKKSIFRRFGIPRAIISDEGSHFYNNAFDVGQV